MIVTTIHGSLDERLLVKTTGVDETDDAVVRWVEYRLRVLDDAEWAALKADGVNNPHIARHDEIVHRSVHADVKATAAAFAKGALFNG